MIQIFSEQAMQQIIAEVRAHKNEPTRTGQSTRPPLPPFMLAWLAKTGPGGIPKRNATTAGKAEVTIQSIDDNDQIVDAVDESGNPITEECFNIFASDDVTANAFIIALQEIASAKLLAVSEDC